jgi:hypothetical protein
MRGEVDQKILAELKGYATSGKENHSPDKQQTVPA